MKKKRIFSILTTILCILLLFLGVLYIYSANWYINVFGDVGFDSILYTLFSDFNGVEKGQVTSYINDVAIPAILVTAAVGLVLFVFTKRKIVIKIAEKIKIPIYPFPRWLSAIGAIGASCFLIVTASEKVDMTDYVKYMLAKPSSFIEDTYVDPKTVDIKFPQEKQNLIIIYLESMETTFLSSEYEGGNDVNPMPELCTLAEQNLNFSHNGTVGGFSSLSGGTWTVGAMVSMTSGVPLKIPFNIDRNSYGNDYFLPGITTLSNILDENGYYQALMVGSDSSYGGRKQYYTQHGADDVYDLFTARNSGFVHPDYWVWWGIEDVRLFEYAKVVLPAFAKKEEPFAFTMLTVDTHHVGGYICTQCKNDFPEQYENVLACSSRQVYDFVNWVKQQDFYENTTIVISGDHPTMDAGYISRNIPEDYNRKVYNCFINSLSDTTNNKNREFCSLDMFPTVLASIGCEIEGDRLGLGTNLFSSTPTLCEELGADVLDKELSKKSNYYNSEFMKLNFNLK